MPEPRQLSNRKRLTVLHRDKYRCRYCGARLTSDTVEIDHVYPWSRGGETSMANCVSACRLCNRVKSDRVGEWPKPVNHWALVEAKRVLIRKLRFGLSPLVDLLTFVFVAALSLGYAASLFGAGGAALNWIMIVSALGSLAGATFELVWRYWNE